MKPVLFHKEAEAEVKDALAWYDEQRAGLGDELLDALQRAVAKLQALPGRHPLHEDGVTRKCVLRRFPYKIFYVEMDDHIWVAAVAHHKRAPDYWAHRIPE